MNSPSTGSQRPFQARKRSPRSSPSRRDCGFAQPGEYQLRLRAQDSTGNWSGYAQTNVIIEGAATGTVPVETRAATATSTDTPTPAPAAVPPGEISVQSISTNTVYVGDSSCGPNQWTITAMATAPKGIQAVVLFYRFEPGSPSGYQDVAMNPAGTNLFQISLNPTSLLGGSLPSGQATLQYQIVVQQKDGDTTIRTPVMSDVAVQPCGAPAPVDCSSYSTKKSCESHGCNWTAKPAIVPVYVCQNP